MYKPIEKYCVLDIETWTPTGKPNPEKDELRYIGFKHYKGSRVCYHYPTDAQKIQKVLDSFEYYVGHNIKTYDIPILKRHGFNIPWSKVLIDTYTISEYRLKTMLYLDINHGDKSLRSLCERFKLQHKKGDFNYKLLFNKELVGQDYDDLVTYLYGDLDSAEDLFKYYYDLFYGFREFVSEKDKKRMSWLTCSSGSTAYKCICNIAKIPQKYEDVEGAQKAYTGAFVSEPYLDTIGGNIYCCDFRSLYPSMMIGFNLFSKYNPDKHKGQEFFNGSNIFPTIQGNEIDGIKGKYLREQGVIEKVLNNLFERRMSVTDQLSKPLDDEIRDRYNKERLAIKILMNTMYGLLGSPIFASIYNLESASDCTSLARRCIKNARTVLETFGYECVYTDTDSVYVLDRKRNINRLKKVLQYITTSQINGMNIMFPHHCFELETEIKQMYFFRNDKGEFIKKHYIYVTKENKIKLKGISLVQGTCSDISKKLFERKIKKELINGSFQFWTAEKCLKELKKITKEFPEKLSKRYRVNKKESYKIPDGKDESTSIHYQISKKYGEGEHFLVANKKIGVGKGIRYAKLEELQEKYGNKWIDQVSYETYMSELSEFIDWKDRKNIHKVDRKRV